MRNRRDRYRLAQEWGLQSIWRQTGEAPASGEAGTVPTSIPSNHGLDSVKWLPMREMMTELTYIIERSH